MQEDRRKVLSIRVPPKVHEELHALAHKLDEPLSTIVLVALKPLMPPNLLPDWRYYGRRLHCPEDIEAAVEKVMRRRLAAARKGLLHRVKVQPGVIL